MRISAPVSAAAALGFAIAGAAASAQPAQITPDMVQHALESQHAALLAQCPAPPQAVPEPQESRFPIHVDRWGQGGRQVLLVHGGVQGRIGGGPRTFARQAALAKLGWSVESMSRPGFGESPSRGPDDMEADARAIAGLFGPRAHVIAHSWGATEALLAAARRPERVRSLIIIEPAIAPTIGGLGVLADPAVAEDLRQRTLTQLSAKTPADGARAFISMMGKVDAEDDRLGPGLASMTEKDAQEFGCNGLYAKMATNDEVLAAIDVVKKAHIPVLVVTGGWSPSIDATGDVLARLLNGRHVVVKSPNHFVQFVNAKDFNALADRFMRDADERRPR